MASSAPEPKSMAVDGIEVDLSPVAEPLIELAEQQVEQTGGS